MAAKGFYTPVKIGLLLVTIAYFLFTLHGTFTLEWIGEWDRIGGGGFRFAIYVEDITAFVCLIFRLAASIIAVTSVVYYFVKKGISEKSTYRILQIVVIFEAIYWIGLSATTYFTVQGFARILVSQSMDRIINSLLLSVIPSVVEAIILPISLIILASKLSPKKPQKSIIRWSLISGILYVLSFWLVYTSIWVGVIRQKGIEFLTARPENVISFGLTAFGLLALAIYIAYFTIRSKGVQSIGDIKLRTVGAILLALGSYFLWNYLSWVILADAQWNNWYAMFLGHNMDLWMLSLPLIALPLLFIQPTGRKTDLLLFATEGIGAVFASIFLTAYLAGIPTTAVLHSDPTVRLSLGILGAILLVLILLTLIIAKIKRKQS
jgi:hypothetical protein